MSGARALALAGALSLAGRASAQAPAIVADRPGFGESTGVVERLRLQVETGAAWTRLSPDSSLADAPQALVRFGIGESLELRVRAPGWLRLRAAGESMSGWSDVSIGVKWHASRGADEVALRATLVLPSGDLGLSDERVDPEGAIAWSRPLSGPWSLGATLGVRRFRAYDQNLVSPSVSIGRELSRGLSTFVEYGGVFASGRLAVHQLDHGYAWLPSPHTQVDLSLGLGLSAAAPDFFVAFGVSRRF